MIKALKIIAEIILFPCFMLIFLVFIVPLSRLRLVIRKIRRQKPRIIWAPIAIISIINNSAADRLMGYQSDTLVYDTYYITKDFTYNLNKYWAIRPLRLVIPWLVLYWACLKYDIFQFFFQGGFLYGNIARYLEFPLLKLAGKKIIVSAYGADVRTEKATRALGKYNCCQDCQARLQACICDDQKGVRNIRHVKRWADISYAMGDMVEYTPGSRHDIFHWPIDLDKIEYVGVVASDGLVKIVHAPNHPQYKGTRFLLETIEQLKKENYQVELTLVEKMSNQEAMDAYKKADIIAEQFIIGWHGFFAVEAMALGKPVICYIRKPEKYLPADTECPIVSANPDNLKEALVRLIKDPRLRQELGEKGRRYVEKIFSLEKFGRQMDELYRQVWNN